MLTSPSPPLAIPSFASRAQMHRAHRSRGTEGSTLLSRRISSTSPLPLHPSSCWLRFFPDNVRELLPRRLSGSPWSRDRL